MAELSHFLPPMPRALTPYTRGPSGTSLKVFAQILLSAPREKLGGSPKVTILRTQTDQDHLGPRHFVHDHGIHPGGSWRVAAAIVASAPQHPGARHVGASLRLGSDRDRTHRSPRAYPGRMVHH